MLLDQRRLAKSKSIHMLNTHDNIPEPTKKISFEWLCEVVSNHELSQTMANDDPFCLDAVFHPEISNTDVFRFGACRQTTILLKFDCTFVVLLKYVILELQGNS